MIGKEFLSHLRHWVSDPFGRKELNKRHDEVLGQIRETTVLVNKVSTQKFPVGHMIRSNRGEYYARHNSK